MTSGKQTVHNVTTINWGVKFYGPPKKGAHTSYYFTDQNQFKPMIKRIGEVGII